MNLGRLVVLAGIAVSACTPRTAARVSSPPGPVVLPPAEPAAVGAPVVPPTAWFADTVQKTAELVADTIYVRRDSALNIRVSDDSIAEVVEALQEGDPVALPMLSLDQYASHDRVEHYVKLFSSSASTRIGERLSRGTRFDPMIREKLRAGGIPEDFRYLALIESGYDPDAYSRAAAVGMWQFMTSTAKKSGLRVDWWVDERRDPVRATDAAIKFLNELRDQFGSYYLAAAAYNGGPGRVSRGLSQLAQELEDDEPEDKFFTLASSNVLRAETRNYVPQIIAAALVGRNPTAYGITVDTQTAFAFDSVEVAPATGLPGIARACATDVPAIVDLNRSVLRGMTPPDGKRTWVRVPPGCGATFADSLAALDSAVRMGAVAVRTKKGDTPASIAKKAGITVTQLRSYNPKLKTAINSAIPVGTIVLVPTRETVRAARNVPDPAVERWGTAVGGTYVVRRGDTLGGIAARHNTNAAALKRINGLRSDKIVVGQKLRVRG